MNSPYMDFAGEVLAGCAATGPILQHALSGNSSLAPLLGGVDSDLGGVVSGGSIHIALIRRSR
jgi:hypothetical protein